LGILEGLIRVRAPVEAGRLTLRQEVGVPRQHVVEGQSLQHVLEPGGRIDARIAQLLPELGEILGLLLRPAE
jgi:hypothetical protein